MGEALAAGRRRAPCEKGERRERANEKRGRVHAAGQHARHGEHACRGPARCGGECPEKGQGRAAHRRGPQRRGLDAKRRADSGDDAPSHAARCQCGHGPLDGAGKPGPALGCLNMGRPLPCLRVRVWLAGCLRHERGHGRVALVLIAQVWDGELGELARGGRSLGGIGAERSRNQVAYRAGKFGLHLGKGPRAPLDLLA